MGRVWLIEAWSGEVLHWQRRIPNEAISEDGMTLMLAGLAAKYLSPNEIIDGSLSAAAGRHSTTLEVQRDDGELTIHAGGFRFTARIEDEAEPS